LASGTGIAFCLNGNGGKEFSHASLGILVGLAGTAAEIARVLFILFIIIFLVGLVTGRKPL
jgi:uncharacterized membrane protein YtjA (UPF0391 family)